MYDELTLFIQRSLAGLTPSRISKDGRQAHARREHDETPRPVGPMQGRGHGMGVRVLPTAVPYLGYGAKPDGIESTGKKRSQASVAPCEIVAEGRGCADGRPKRRGRAQTPSDAAELFALSRGETGIAAPKPT